MGFDGLDADLLNPFKRCDGRCCLDDWCMDDRVDDCICGRRYGRNCLCLCWDTSRNCWLSPCTGRCVLLSETDSDDLSGGAHVS